MKTKIHLQFCKEGGSNRYLLNNLLYWGSGKNVVIFDKKYDEWFLEIYLENNELENNELENKFDRYNKFRNDYNLRLHDYYYLKYYKIKEMECNED